MNLSRLSLFASASLTLLALVGCTAKSTSSAASEGSLGASESALEADNTDSQDAEDATEDGIENGLSGATGADPGTPAEGGDVAALDEKVKTNPGRYFTPAGCIVSTRVSAGVWNHVFLNCTEPGGKVSYTGTVKSTWAATLGSTSVKHEATDFVVKGPRVSVTLFGSREVSFTRAGAVVTKKRVGSWTGTLTRNADPSKSLPWSHQADFTSSWDTGTKCYTRDGSATNSVGGRAFGRKVSGFKVCGGLSACPSSGQLELDRKDGSVKIVITFLGGQDADVARPRGTTVKAKLACTTSS